MIRKWLQKLENSLLAMLLRRMSTVGMDHKVFTEIARKFVLTTVNIIVFRKDEGVLQILLIERPADDPCWPGMLHVPGTVLRRDDKVGNPIGSGDPIRRLLAGELATRLKSPPTFVGDFHVSDSARGAEMSKVFFGELEGEPPRGKFYDLPGLWDNKKFIAEEIPWITAAMLLYQHRR